jgi:hypothetical protein
MLGRRHLVKKTTMTIRPSRTPQRPVSWTGPLVLGAFILGGIGVGGEELVTKRIEYDREATPAHWAWLKPRRPELPAVNRSDWTRSAIDHFVLARLEREGLSPAPEADRYTLIRRVYLDVIGLPPSPQEVDAFASDPRPDAYERLIDRLLADPAFGERWARVWLDLARYADSKGYGSDPLRTIWRYRDWVIDAFNRSLPYDQFTIEQLAGDLLPAPTTEQLLATAFHRNTMANDEGGTDDELFRVEAVKDRVDTTMQVWMGLTAGCAKCHSHKFDPITQREYYQFFAFFNQTEDADRGDESPRLATPTPLQEFERRRIAGEIGAAKTQLDAPTPELAAAQSKWEASLAREADAWTVLDPGEVRSAAGANLEKQPDRSILVSGESPDKDTYTITTDVGIKGVTAFRLEALPHDGLPGKGPGRSSSGNFALNELRVTAGGNKDKSLAGRYVRVEIPGPNKILSLAEVQVFRADDNLALQATATQSSTDYDGPAKLAIDGNTNGHYFEAKSTTHTKAEENPWWEVDLGIAKPVDRIVIWNRTDGDTEARLNNFRVSLLDTERRPVLQTTFADPPRPSLMIDVGGPVSIELKNPTVDFAQVDWPAIKATDGDTGEKSGWAVAPQFGRPHMLVVEVARPNQVDADAKPTFTLVHSFGSQHTLGRFRLSATSASPPPRVLPSAISDIVVIAPADRTADQAAELARYYRSIAPELQPVRARVAQLEEQMKNLEKQISTTPILRELASDKRRPTHVLIKSNFMLKGEAVEPGVPAAFHRLRTTVSDSAASVTGPSARLDLARWLVDSDNPLTARVAANRFWAHIFGRGLVATEEDFGTQGLPPSHPALLDWLAVTFMGSAVSDQQSAVGDVAAWDVKSLVRLIVTSATYRQSSSPSAAAMQKDPDNVLLSRGPRHRLEAEMVRDQALAFAGLLSRKVGGPSVYPPQPPGLWRAAFNGERTWATSTGDDRYRRGLYTFWRRTVPYPSMATFDAPSREICTIRRVPTNTPLQAFVTLNDPAFVEMAQALARRIVREGGATPRERAAFGLRLCLARPPRDEQVAEIVALFDHQLDIYRKDSTAAQQITTDPLGPAPTGLDAGELAAWTVVSNVLLNLDAVLSKR